MISARPSRRALLRFMAFLGLLLGPGSAPVGAQDFDIEVPGLDEETPAPPPGGATLFENVRIFDGRSAGFRHPSNVLVRGNNIERISAEPDRRRRDAMSDDRRPADACSCQASSMPIGMPSWPPRPSRC